MLSINKRLETTGLADPGPIASMFWLDEELQSSVYLDGIVTVVDAKYIITHLERTLDDDCVNEAIKQVALADRILINKLDLITSQDLKAIQEKISCINASALQATCTRSKVPIDFILNIHSFDKRTETEIRNIREIPNNHTKSVSTIAFSLKGEFDLEKIDICLRNLLWEKEIDGKSVDMEIFRVKMLINGTGMDQKIIFQGVRDFYDQQIGSHWKDEDRESKFVFIGKNLDKDLFSQSLERNCKKI